MEWRVLDGFVLVSVWCGGPDGGLLIVEAKTEPRVVAAATDVTVVHPENPVFLPRYQAFICAGDLVAFDDLERAADVTVVTVDGRVVQSDIGVREAERSSTGTRLLSSCKGDPSGHKAWISYIDDEDLLIFKVLNDYRNRPMLTSCKASVLLRTLGILG